MQRRSWQQGRLASWKPSGTGPISSSQWILCTCLILPELLTRIFG